MCNYHGGSSLIIRKFYTYKLLVFVNYLFLHVLLFDIHGSNILKYYSANYSLLKCVKISLDPDAQVQPEV